MKHYFIINPAAGSHDATDEIKSAIMNLDEAIDYEIYITNHQGDATEYIKSVLSATDEECRFYACGGDGTLNEVASGVVGFKNASIAAYPCGSGNDYIKYYGKKEDFLNIKALVTGVEKEIDLIKSCGRYAINAVHFGFDTAVLKTMMKVRRKFLIGGKNAYTTGVVTALIHSMKTFCSFKSDGETIGNEKMLLATIANGKFVGGAYQCSPRSINDDGLLEVCKVNTLSRLTFIKLINIYKQGKHLDDKRIAKYINYRRAKKVEVEFNGIGDVSIDGELVHVKKFTAEIMEKAIKFVVPSSLVKESNIDIIGGEKELVH